jgi:hypothetical protein
MHAFVLAVSLSLCALPALAQDYRLQSTAATELQQMCTVDAGELWTASLCGPLIVVDGNTRQAWATQHDNLNILSIASGGGWAGVLPEGVPVANTTVDWGGVQWIMVVGPLPEDTITRRVLLAHEAWHRVQESLGLPMQGANAGHLETERGRYLMRLEMRALATAMLSNRRARRNAARDALAFRMARLSSFPEAPAAEAGLDRNEGLASYTGVRLGAGDQARQFAARTLNGYDQHQALARAYAYATGPAYGLLLDEYAPNWRTQLAAWAPADLLVSPLRARALSERDLQRRAGRYAGPQIAAEERARAENQRRLIAELIARYSGARIELPLGQMQFEFDPEQVIPVPNLGTVYRRLVLRDAWGQLRATEGALISPSFDRLIAAAPDPDGLAGPGWTLDLAPGYHISAPDAEGVVRPEVALQQQPSGRQPRN